MFRFRSIKQYRIFFEEHDSIVTARYIWNFLINVGLDDECWVKTHQCVHKDTRVPVVSSVINVRANLTMCIATDSRHEAEFYRQYYVTAWMH